ncbi:MAG: recombinase family protein [Firmicutes bacterium]|nr:recombinase family protein [Bacillota bacterium]
MEAIYARQSLDKKDSISIETQIDICHKELTPGQDFLVYKDKGFSGKNTDRPDFQRLLSDVAQNKITKIVVYRLDRISRSITDFASIINLLAVHKVDFVSANEKFDTATAVGRAMVYIVMVFAQLERETIAERIRDNYYARGQYGVWLGGPAPLGYTNIKEIRNGKKVAKLIPNDQEMGLVQAIYKRYATSNVSLGGLAKELKAKHGGMWSNVKLARILHNPAYVKADADIYHFYQAKNVVIINPIEEFTGEYGCSLYGKRDRGANKYTALDNQVLSIALHNGVVDAKTWLQCQAKMDGNRQIKNTGKGKHSWLTGLVKCGYCGYGMSVKVYNNTKYLACTGRYIADKCAKKLAPHYLKDIEEYVYSEMQNFITKLEIDQIYQEAVPETDTNSLKIELHNVEREIDGLLTSLPNANDVLMKYINTKILDLDSKKITLLASINNAAVKPQQIIIPDLDNWEIFDMESKRDAAKALIKNVLVYNDSIRISWNI